MELDDFPGRFKAAKLLATPNAEEEAARATEGVKRIHGVTTPEVATRINQGGLSYATLRNMENGVRQPEERDIYAIAKALELPMAFFLLTRRQLAGALEAAGAPAIPGATGRRLQEDPPTRAGRSQPASDAGEGTPHAGRG